MALILSVFTAIQYGLSDFSGGMATRKNSVFFVIVLSQVLGLATGLAIIPSLSPGLPGLRDLWWGAAAGVGGALGLVVLYHALARSIVSIVSPAAALTGAVVPLVYGLILGERIGTLGLVGIGLALPAIAALSIEPGDTENAPGKSARALMYGVLSGLGFGLFFICISRTSETSGLWPLIASRTASIALLVPILFRRRRKTDRTLHAVFPLIVAGVLDMGANITLLLAMRSGLLVIVTTVSSLYPAPTVILARLIFKERISAVRWSGLVLAVIGVALMGLE